MPHHTHERSDEPKATKGRLHGEGPKVMELKSYTLADSEAIARYTTEFWPRHIRSLREFGITVQGLWTDTRAGSNRVFALIEYPQGEDPADAANRYRASQNFADDHADFDDLRITAEETVPLHAVAASRMQ